MAIPRSHNPKSDTDDRIVVSVEDFATEIVRRGNGDRLVVAIAGPPGSGKTTTSSALETRLLNVHGVKTQTVPMDGFHYDNAILDRLDLLSRKGSPATFDVAGLDSALRRLTRGCKDNVAIPVFDREIDLSRASARLIDRDTSVLLVEGNYLLLAKGPWPKLREYFDMTAMIVSDEDGLRARLMKRWLDLDHSKREASVKVETNDLPNARQVIHESVPADFNLAW